MPKADGSKKNIRVAREALAERVADQQAEQEAEVLDMLKDGPLRPMDIRKLTGWGEDRVRWVLTRLLNAEEVAVKKRGLSKFYALAMPPETVVDRHPDPTYARPGAEVYYEDRGAGTRIVRFGDKWRPGRGVRVRDPGGKASSLEGV